VRHGFRDSSAREPVAVFVEGNSDAGFIEELCRRLNLYCKAYVLGGNNPEKAIRKVKAVAEQFKHVIVLKNTHMLRSELLEEFERKVESKLRGVARVKVLRVVSSIESWILAGLCEENPESIPNPEARLAERLGRFIVKSEGEYRKLASSVNIEHATRKSGSFKAFLEAILSTPSSRSSNLN